MSDEYTDRWADRKTVRHKYIIKIDRKDRERLRDRKRES
jgi:hypothetical protein